MKSQPFLTCLHFTGTIINLTGAVNCQPNCNRCRHKHHSLRSVKLISSSSSLESTRWYIFKRPGKIWCIVCRSGYDFTKEYIRWLNLFHLWTNHIICASTSDSFTFCCGLVALQNTTVDSTLTSKKLLLLVVQVSSVVECGLQVHHCIYFQGS